MLSIDDDYLERNVCYPSLHSLMYVYTAYVHVNHVVHISENSSIMVAYSCEVLMFACINIVNQYVNVSSRIT